MRDWARARWLGTTVCVCLSVALASPSASLADGSSPPTLTEHTVLSGSQSGWVEVYLDQPLQVSAQDSSGQSHQLITIHADGTGALEGMLLFSENVYSPGEFGPGPSHDEGFAIANWVAPGDNLVLSTPARTLNPGPYRLYLFTAPGSPLTIDMTLPGLDPGDTALTPSNPSSVTYRDPLPQRTPARWQSIRAEAGGTADLSSLGMIWQQDSFTWPAPGAPVSSPFLPQIQSLEWCDATELASSPDWSGCPSDTDTSALANTPVDGQTFGSASSSKVIRVAAYQCAGRYQVGIGASNYDGPQPSVAVTAAWIPLDLPNSWSPPGGATCGSSPNTPPGNPTPSSSTNQPSQAPPPASTPSVAPQATLAANTLATTSTHARAIVRCQASTCIGTARLANALAIHFDVAAGHTAVLALSLPRSLQTRLHRAGRVRATLVVALQTAHGLIVSRQGVWLRRTRG